MGTRLRKVVLFTGHMIDASDRPSPRFPADKETVAAFAIEAALTEIKVAAGDVAICGGACGGDLLFAEACIKRDVLVELHIPFDEPRFLESSVDFAGGNWHGRFLLAKSRSILHIMPDELPPESLDTNPYERNNRWMLQSAARFEDARIAVIALWDGQQGRAGGTGHFIAEARRQTDSIFWLNTTALWD